MERFNSLYYIHHSLIINDNSKKDIIYLKIHDSIITDSYLNKGYRSEDEKKEMIESTIKESEKFDKEIELYYDIIKSYTEDYEKIGKKEAKKKYLEALKSNKIYWKNNWD